MRVFFVWIGKMRGRIGNPKQKLRRNRKKRNYIRVDTTTKNNKDYFNQQHQQLIPTTLRPKQHIGRSGGICKTIVVQFNCQLKFVNSRVPEYIRGNGHRKTKTNARPLAKAKQNEGRGEKRATR